MKRVIKKNARFGTACAFSIMEVCPDCEAAIPPVSVLEVAIVNDTKTTRLRPASGDDADSLVAALLEDMGRCWTAGERPCAHDYFAAHPELAGQTDACVRLIYEEICLRQEHGENVPHEEILARYPHWRNELKSLLACHSLLAECTFDDLPDDEPVLADYTVVKELGRGGQGRVYLARQDTLDDRPVVLKISPCRGNEHFTLARLQHTNIVPLYAAADDAAQNTRILCMPYFGGATLQALMSSLPATSRHGSDLLAALDRQQAALPIPISGRGPMRQFLAAASYEKAIAWIGSCLAEALHFAHERSYVHLDIKPANILLAADGQPMLLDFHIAQRPLIVGSYPPPGFGGTRAYMSPEQRAAVDAADIHEPLSTAVDARTDIYSLGLVLFEALGGHLPPNTARQPDPSRLAVPAGLRDILSRCLAGNPADRYPNAAAVAEDLRCHVQDLPLKSIRNRSLVERWQKWRRRRPAALPLAVMLGAVLLAALSLLLVAYRHGSAQLQEAENSLANGKELYHQRRHTEAVQVLRQGIRIAESLGRENLLHSLHQEMDRSRRANVAEKLHNLADAFRNYGADPSLLGNLKNLEDKWRNVWEQRTWLAAAPAAGLSPAEHERVKSDLLDLALIWSALQVRLAPAADKRTAQETALALLQEAETEFGASPALLLQRRELGQEPAFPQAGYGQPKSAWEHYALGRALLDHGKLGQADDLLRRAVELDPQGYWPNFYLGLCALQREDYVEADGAFRVCIALAPDNVAGHYNRGLALTKLGQGQQAIAAFGRALQLDARLGGAAYRRGILYLEAKRFNEALTDFQHALARGHDPAAFHYQLALLHAAQGNNNAARAAVHESLRVNPEFRLAVELLERLEGS